MKRYFSYIVLSMILLLVSCDGSFLDRSPLDQINNGSFWNTERDAVAAATGCYNGWYSASELLYFDCTSDNSYNPYPWEGWQVQANGVATASNTGKSYMQYDKITRCNNFLENISRPTMNEDLRKRLIAEVRFLRAWHYFLKVTLYGDVPLITEVLTIQNSNLPRTDKKEVIKFIIDELDAAKKDLPIKYSGSDVGRITRGAALTLKARMEIFDGNYEASLKTSEEIMEIGYSLFHDYKGLFKISNVGNQEVILDVQYVETNYNNTILGVMPPASVGGWSSINPTQSLVDSYECIDGMPIEESPIYNANDPYANRDPRLDAAIIYPGCMYEGAYFNSIDESDPTGDFYAPYGRSKTGYHPRKYIDNLSDYEDMWNTAMNPIVMRYAEVLLMYAESKIELNQIDNLMYDALDDVRLRSNMPKVDRSVYNNQSNLRELVRRERRVELALEGLRWFDICRWEIGDEVMSGQVYGARLGKVDASTGKLTLTDERIKVEMRTFDATKQYLWPIPQSVIDATPAIVQNPKY